MAYDRYESRRDWRETRSRWRDEDRDFAASAARTPDRDRDERGWFERAGDEIASWFGDEEAERRRQEHPDRFSGHLRNGGVRRDYGERDRGADRDPRRDRAFMSDEDFGRFERSPRWRDEGYRRPYTGRFPAAASSARPRRPGAYRPAGDLSRGIDERSEHGGSYYGVGAAPRPPLRRVAGTAARRARPRL